MPLGLAALGFVLALVQRPGWSTSDTKIDLHVDPSGFLSDVASVWTPSGALGHVQGGQYSGYLFPMGPFFALGHRLGLADWVVGRLWLGLLVALAAWGVVRLIDALYEPRRGVAHVVAGLLIVLNPYVVVFSNQTSVTLLGYAAMPWLLLIVNRGLRNPRGWWWPAALALLFTCIGGGVNAAVVAWLIPAALLMALHEPLRGYVPWRAVLRFALRAVPLAFVASLWWIVPVLVQSGYGIDFLKFTEQQGAIWSTTGLSEAIRLMSYWISYVGGGFGAHPEPYFSDSATLLFDLPVVIASLLVPALALTGFVWTRRWRYGPFFLAMVLVGLVTMTVGFPEGTPLRSAANFTYNHVAAVQFLRTTYKAAPMVALGLACLGGVAASQACERLATVPRRRAGLAFAGMALVALAAWPLVSGQALERKLSWKRIPAAWQQAGSDLDRTLPANTRAVVLPGQLFSFYRWGGTVDPILPALTGKPVAVRSIVPYADLRAIDMLWTADTLLEQQRVLPGQLRPLLGLISAGAVVTGTDDDRNRSGSMPAAEAAGLLQGQGLGAPTTSYGPALGFRPSAQMLGPTVRLPQVRSYDVSQGARGLVRLESGRDTGMVVDGSAQAFADLASFGALPRAGSPAFYAADRTRGQIGSAREVVISDSNRRRSFLSSQIQGNVGPTLAASEPLSPDAAALNPFPDAGTDAQTVAQYDGAAYLRAPLSPQFTQFPEHRPFAAFDGSPRTSWLADPELDKSRSFVEVGFTGDRAVDHIVVLPHDDSRAQVTAIAVAGKRFAVHPGWNRLELGLPAVRSLRLTIVGLRKPPDLPRGAGGFDEVRVPGLAVHERLRPPVLATRALVSDVGSSPRLTYLFDRTAADEPYRTGSVVNDAQLRSRLDRQDPEPLLSRTFGVPRAIRLTADSWTSIDPRAPDSAIDRFAGYRGGVRFTSSSRFDGVPGYRASGAFDGDAARGWIGTWIPRRPAWIAWRSRRPTTLPSLRLTRLAAPVRFPTRVRVVTGGGAATPALDVGPGGEVRLPRPLRSRTFRIDVLAAAFPAGTPRAERGRRAVGIADVVGGPGARMPRSGPARLTCGAALLRLGGQTLSLRPRATIEQLDAGVPIRAAQCGGAQGVSLPSGTQQLDGVSGPVRVDHAMLRSPAPASPAITTRDTARVTDPGDFGRSEVSGVRLSGAAGHWLVLGQSYNRGWRAYCGDHSLGEPVAIDGFANGWLVDRDCPRASFRFQPQRAVQWGYWISGIACLLLLGFLLIRRRRRRPVEALDPWLPERAVPAPMALARAAAIALPAALALAFLFAIRAGPPVWVGLTLILWRGIGARALTLAAGALLALAVPVLYVLFPGPDRGGFNPEYAVKHLGAHWVAVAAYVLLVAALARTLSRASRASGDRRAERAA